MQPTPTRLTDPLISTFVHQEDGTYFFGATVGDMIVSAWQDDEQSAQEEAVSFLDDPLDWLNGLIRLADFVDESPSIRPAIQDVHQRLNIVLNILNKQTRTIKKSIAAWQN